MPSTDQGSDEPFRGVGKGCNRASRLVLPVKPTARGFLHPLCGSQTGEPCPSPLLGGVDGGPLGASLILQQAVSSYDSNWGVGRTQSQDLEDV